MSKVMCVFKEGWEDASRSWQPTENNTSRIEKSSKCMAYGSTGVSSVQSHGKSSQIHCYDWLATMKTTCVKSHHLLLSVHSLHACNFASWLCGLFIFIDFVSKKILPVNLSDLSFHNRLVLFESSILIYLTEA